ncbi:MAG: 3-deoxy-D-manno-octulosonic acid transferase [Deltaproteobacteria bacterium]|nr:3-deoxy-D-manno-octulosonic acid transferase [Deltaproteobacteria bacterium]
MEPSLLAYNYGLALAAAGLGPVYLAARLAGRWPEFWPRAGLFRRLPPPEPGPRVWLQAVSVGEIAVARALADELDRQEIKASLIVTSSTARGLERAREVFAGRALVAPYPLDLPWSVAAAVSRLRPDVYVSLETEIWPNLLWWLERRGVPALLLNGRLSPRSYPLYRRIRPVIAPALARFVTLSMITHADAARAVALGAPPARVRVDGNAKYAGLLERVHPADLDQVAHTLAVADQPLFVAGSVRSGEEEAVLTAYSQVLTRHPEAVLAVAPRHVERASRWLAACARASFPAQRWSELSPEAPRRPDTRVVVVDVMGRLMDIYGLAVAVFVGASLVELGGQNPMEPAAWGKPVYFGPDMSDFADARQALEEAGGGFTVASGDQLGWGWLECLDDPDAARQAGLAARRVVAAWSGAASRAAQLVAETLALVGRPR